MNLPNRITLCRILLIPVFMFFFMADFIPYGKLIAAIVFAVACFTDFLDGHIARSRGLVTDLGKFFDAIADKVLTMTGFVMLISWNITPHVASAAAAPAIFPSYVGIVACVIILAREFIVSAFRQIAAAKNVILAADIYGKVKTVFQFITLFYYFIYAFIIEEFYNATVQAWLTANTVISIVGYVLIAVTVIMTIVSGAKYIANNTKVFKDDKK